MVESNVEKLIDLAHQFQTTCENLYSGGLYRGWSDGKDHLFRRERELRRAYREALLTHFGSIAVIPDNLHQYLEALHPESWRICLDVALALSRTKSRKLPLSQDHPNMPFRIFSKNLQHEIITLGHEEDFYKTAPALVTTDRNSEGYHVCISHLPGTENARSPTCAIESFADEIRKNLGWKAAFTPIHFYLHVPPEVGICGETFQKVEMKRSIFGQYQRPDWGEDRLDEIPPGIDKGFVKLVPKPEIRVDEDYKDNSGTMHDYRRYAVADYEALVA